MLITHETLEKLYHTGWQSWSWKDPEKTIIKLPTNCFPPASVTIPDSIKVDIKLKNPAKGWCSYHPFRHNISEEIILNQVKAFEQNSLHAFEYIIIDGGWEKEWGGFEYDKTKFPHGLKYLVKEITKHGFKAGIWLSPFLTIPHAKLVKEHPEWFVKDKNGNFIEGMRLTPLSNYFSKKKYILDYTNPHVVSYLDNIIAWLLEDCQFSLLKLDWLYSLYYNPNLTMAQADILFRSFLMKIKKKYPSVHINGCGAPLIPAIGAVDSMRIGPDNIDPRHQNIPIVNKLANTYFYNLALHGAKARGWTKKYWVVDLDAFLCRESLGLSDEQIIRFQRTLIETKSNIFLGDDISTLPKERIEKFIRPLINT